YIDLLSNFGSAIHGHAHPRIVDATRGRVAKGTDFGSPTTLHLAMARELSARMPAMEQLRFTTSGSESILYAVRAARAFTGRPKILKMEGSYHGGYDGVTVSVDPGLDAPDPPQGVASSRGLPPDIAQHTLVSRYNDLDGAVRIIRAHKHELAAVLVEPVVM